MNISLKGIQIKIRSSLPKAPPIHEEPINGLQPGQEACKLCGKTFQTHTQLDRHMEHMHGTPEKTHTKPHTVE